jgi:GNAT superfamily N-acetyltransferase
MRLSVIETIPNDTWWLEFVHFPKQLYTTEEYHRVDAVPLEGVDGHCLLALEDDKAVGRCVVFANRRTGDDKDRFATVGYYECKPQSFYARRLLQEAESIARKWGVKSIVGPVNGFSSWDVYRFKSHNHKKAFLLENHNLDYYSFQWEENGFQPIKRYYSHRIDQVIFDSDVLIALSKEMLAKGFQIEPFFTDHPERELEALYPLVMNAFSSAFLFQWISKSEFVARYQKALPLIQTDYVLIAKNKNSEPIGFLFAYPDLLDRTGKTLVVKTLVRNSNQEYKGVGQWLSNELMRNAGKSGIETVIPAYMAEDARSHFTASLFNSKQATEYLLFSKDVY